MSGENTNMAGQIKDQTIGLMKKIIKHNHLDTTCMTKDATWYVGSAAQSVTTDRIDEYLNAVLIDMPVDEPQVLFVKTDSLGESCISVTGKMEYHTTNEDTIKLSFNADWIFTNSDWKLKKLITTSRKTELKPGVWSGGVDARIDQDTLYGSIPVGVMCCTNDDFLSVKLINRNGYELLGFSSIIEYKRVSGESLLADIHPDDIAVFREFIERVRRDGVAQSEPFRIRKKDFTYFWGQFSGSVAEDRWLVLICIDHSDQQKKVHSLQRQHEKLEELNEDYHMMVDSMPGGFHRCTLFPPIHMDFVSESFCEMSGYSRKEIFEDLEAAYVKLVVPEDRDIIISAVKRLMEYPHTENMEYRIQKKDGSIFWVSDYIRSVRRPDGKMYAYSIVEKIDQDYFNKTILSDLIESMPIGYAMYRYQNDSLEMLYCNDAYVRPSGYSKVVYMELSRRNPLVMLLAEDILMVEENLGNLRYVKAAARIEKDVRLVGKTQITKVHLTVDIDPHENGETFLHVFLEEREKDETENVIIRGPSIECVDENKPEHTVEIHTFGYFEMFVDGEPIRFHSQKAQELLALLVDRRGGFVSQSMIISSLWENETANKSTLSRCRKTYKTLVDELKLYGIEDIVESNRGARRIIPEKVQCDLLQYRSGMAKYRHLFSGVYMPEYAWSRITRNELLSESNVGAD